nr:putative reverse transcriptase domain-containing protein [Tanacetum cinerariifolium]
MSFLERLRNQRLCCVFKGARPDYGVTGDDYEGPPIFDDDQFEDELKMEDDAFVLIGKEVAPNSEIPEAMFPLLEKFSDVFHDELPDALPSLCDIPHHIDLEPSSQLPNRPHYRLCPGEHEELHRQVEEFVFKGHICKIMSTCAQPRGPLDLIDYGVAGDDYEGPLMFDDDQFEDVLEMGDDAFVLIGKEVAPNSKIPEAMFPLLEEFSNVFHDELPDALQPLCDIQHHIDLEPSSRLPNRPHYRLRLREHEELRRQVEEFISKGHIHKIMSTCAQPRGPLDLMSFLVFGSVPKKVHDFVEGFPYQGDSSDDDLVGNSRTNFVYL